MYGKYTVYAWIVQITQVDNLAYILYVSVIPHLVKYLIRFLIFSYIEVTMRKFNHVTL